jgi:hypothetical protein
MADPFAPAIDTVLTGLGYQCQQLAMPTYRDYDPAQPTVYICPVSKPIIQWLAFQSKSNRQAYDVVYAFKNELNPALSANDVYDFKADVIEYFMGINSDMRTAGAWNTTAEDVTDYSRPLFAQGYTYSQIRVMVDYLSN